MQLSSRILKDYNSQPIFWLILCLSLVISPHLSRFPLWSIGLIFGLFFWRFISLKNQHWLGGKWLLIIIMLLSCSGIYLHFGTLFGKTAGSVLLSILLAIKLHESNSTRDYMLLISLSFFIMLTNFLFSQSIPSVLFMLATIIVLVISMISINQHSANISLKYKFKLALKLIFQSLPLMLILFVLFPRISGPLWSLPDESNASTGLSDRMSPGNISRLIQSNESVFRVKFNDEIPPQNKLYWRTLVLWYFDGRTWEKGKENITAYASVIPLSPESFSYTITMQPNQKTWLYALDMPIKVPSKILYTNNSVLRSPQKNSVLYQYQITSTLHYQLQKELSPWELSAGLKIPIQENTNPKTQAFAKQLVNKFKQPEKIIQKVLSFYNEENFYYTLQPPITPGENPVDQFLFTTRRGFCEHYASSFTFIMRAAGIPARIVLGYQGGSINPLNHVINIRQSDAHAWSEVWLKDKGWLRIDPTAAIAPQRVEINLDAALAQNESRPFHMQINTGLIKELLFYWDALDNQWNQWVIGYDTKLQEKFINSLLQKKTQLADLMLYMVVGFISILILLSLIIIKPWQRKKTDPIVYIYNQFCKKLASRGVQRAHHEGPYDYAYRAVKIIPEHKNTINLITRLYSKLRYEAEHNSKQFAQFRQLVKRFKI